MRAQHPAVKVRRDLTMEYIVYKVFKRIGDSTEIIRKGGLL